MTGQDKVLDALGAALGDAAREPSRVDEVELLVMGLEDIREQHIRVLALLSSEGGGAVGIAARGNMSEDDAAALLTRLANAGFARTESLWSGLGYGITTLGQTLLDVLAQLGESR